MRERGFLLIREWLLRHGCSTIQTAKTFQSCVQENMGSQNFQMLIKVYRIHERDVIQAILNPLQWSAFCYWLRHISMLGVKHSFLYFRQTYMRLTAELRSHLLRNS